MIRYFFTLPGTKTGLALRVIERSAPASLIARARLAGTSPARIIAAARCAIALAAIAASANQALPLAVVAVEQARIVRAHERGLGAGVDKPKRCADTTEAELLSISTHRNSEGPGLAKVSRAFAFIRHYKSIEDRRRCRELPNLDPHAQTPTVETALLRGHGAARRVHATRRPRNDLKP